MIVTSCCTVSERGGQNVCNLYVTTEHVFENFLWAIARFPPGRGQ